LLSRVRAAEVIALAAATVVEDLVPAISIGDAFEPGGDLGNRGVPIDFFIAAVGTPTHGGGKAVAVVLVVVQPQRLVAGIALRRGMVFVATDLREIAAVELHDDATVALAQDACR